MLSSLQPRFLADEVRASLPARGFLGGRGPGCFRSLGFLPVFAAVLLNGCEANKSILGPNHPLTTISTAPLRDDLVHSGDIAAWKKAYDDATDDADRVYYRNRIVRQLMLVTDQDYLAWSQQLFGARAISSTAADIASGVLSAFAAASGASAAKSIALVLTGISTTRLAVEKNLLLEQTSGALIAQMDNDRAKVSLQVGQYLRQGTSDYPLEEALRDLLRYYKAGTLASAGTSLQAAAVQSREATQAAVEQDKGDTVVAPGILQRSAVAPLSTPSAAAVQDRLQGGAPAPPPPPGVRLRERTGQTRDRALSSGRSNNALGIRKRLLAHWIADRAAAGDVQALRDCAGKLTLLPLPDTALADAIRTRLSAADTGAKLSAIETAAGSSVEPPSATPAGPPPVTITDRPDVRPDRPATGGHP